MAQIAIAIAVWCTKPYYYGTLIEYQNKQQACRDAMIACISNTSGGWVETKLPDCAKATKP